MSGWRTQGFRFVVVGALSNALLYALYLALTALGADYKLAMTVLYGLGVAQTFFFNKSWTFGHRGRSGLPAAKYLLAYGLCYVMNILALVLFADYLGLPHQLVQATMICVVAAVMFLLQKFWIFSPGPANLKPKEL